jgi:hypothetical protein
MLGSKSTFFIAGSCNFCQGSCISSLDAKGYSAEQIAVYIKAFDYLENPDDFDGATSKRPYGCAWHRLGRAAARLPLRRM